MTRNIAVLVCLPALIDSFGAATLTHLLQDKINAQGIDIFRFDDNGRIVEHRAVLQVVPSASQNDNGLF